MAAINLFSEFPDPKKLPKRKKGLGMRSADGPGAVERGVRRNREGRPSLDAPSLGPGPDMSQFGMRRGADPDPRAPVDRLGERSLAGLAQELSLGPGPGAGRSLTQLRQATPGTLEHTMALYDMAVYGQVTGGRTNDPRRAAFRARMAELLGSGSDPGGIGNDLTERKLERGFHEVQVNVNTALAQELVERAGGDPLDWEAVMMAQGALIESGLVLRTGEMPANDVLGARPTVPGFHEAAMVLGNLPELGWKIGEELGLAAIEAFHGEFMAQMTRQQLETSPQAQDGRQAATGILQTLTYAGGLALPRALSDVYLQQTGFDKPGLTKFGEALDPAQRVLLRDMVPGVEEAEVQAASQALNRDPASYIGKGLANFAPMLNPSTAPGAFRSILFNSVAEAKDPLDAVKKVAELYTLRESDIETLLDPDARWEDKLLTGFGTVLALRGAMGDVQNARAAVRRAQGTKIIQQQLRIGPEKANQIYDVLQGIERMAQQKPNRFGRLTAAWAAKAGRRWPAALDPQSAYGVEGAPVAGAKPVEAVDPGARVDATPTGEPIEGGFEIAAEPPGPVTPQAEADLPPVPAETPPAEPPVKAPPRAPAAEPPVEEPSTDTAPEPVGGAPKPQEPTAPVVQGPQTPLMRQHAAAKAANPDALVAVRVGDFYEFYGDDAKVAAKVLGITLTGREDGQNGRIPMAGVPFHSVEKHLDTLVKAGHKVALADPLREEPAEPTQSKKPSLEPPASTDVPKPGQAKEPWEMTDTDWDAKYPIAGETSDGRTIGKEIKNESSIDSSLTEYTELDGIRDVPVALFEDSGPPVFYSAAEEARTKALADEIKSSGRIDPLIVVDDGEHSPYILEGGHRFDALKMLGAKSFPAKVVVDDEAVYQARDKTKSEGKPVPPYGPKPAQPEPPTQDAEPAAPVEGQAPPTRPQEAKEPKEAKEPEAPKAPKAPTPASGAEPNGASGKEPQKKSAAETLAEAAANDPAIQAKLAALKAARDKGLLRESRAAEPQRGRKKKGRAAAPTDVASAIKSATAAALRALTKVGRKPAGKQPARPERGRKGVGEVVSRQVERDMALKDGTELVGKTLRDAKDVGVAAHVFRDPLWETSRVIYVDERGTVLSVENATYRLPDVTLGWSGMRDHIGARMRALGAERFYVLHNHPGGDPSPSEADKNDSAWLAQRFAGSDAYGGSVVIDHTRYAVIAPGDVGGVTFHPLPRELWRESKPARPGPLLGASVLRRDDLVRLAPSFRAHGAAGGATVVAVDSRRNVQAVLELTPEDVAQLVEMGPAKSAAFLSSFARGSGSGQVAILLDDMAVFDQAHPRAAAFVKHWSRRDLIYAVADRWGAVRGPSEPWFISGRDMRGRPAFLFEQRFPEPVIATMPGIDPEVLSLVHDFSVTLWNLGLRGQDFQSMMAEHAGLAGAAYAMVAEPHFEKFDWGRGTVGEETIDNGRSEDTTDPAPAGTSPERVETSEPGGAEGTRGVPGDRAGAGEGDSGGLGQGGSVGERGPDGGDSPRVPETGGDGGGRAEAASGRAPLGDGARRRLKESDLGGERAGPPPGEAAKAAAMVEAVRALRAAEERGHATREEQVAMSRFPGWGPFKAMAAGGRDAELAAMMTPAEKARAYAASVNSHFTAPELVKAVWKALEDAGVAADGTLKILEPSAGSGLFRLLAPEAIGDLPSWSMVEKDATTAGLLKFLNPDVDVKRTGFERVTGISDTQGVVVSNVPFGNQAAVVDAELRARYPDDATHLEQRIHNYFLAKSIDSAAPGGLVAIVTSAGTMNAGDDVALATRRWVAERADLVGAVRLPESTHRKTANTDVVTDVLVFRKKGGTAEVPAGAVIPADVWAGEPVEVWLSDKRGNSVKARVSGLFADGTRVVGRQTMTGSMHGRGDQYNVVLDGENGPEKVAEMMADILKIKPGTFAPDYSVAEKAAHKAGLVKVPPERAVGSIVRADDGTLVQVFAPGVARGLGERPWFKAKDTKLVESYIDVRDAQDAVIQAQLTGTDAELSAAQAALKKAYKAFVAKHGPLNSFRLNSKGNRTLVHQTKLWNDVYGPRVFALEVTNSDTGEVVGLADMAEKRIGLTKEREFDMSDPVDALYASVSKTGRPDPDMVAAESGKTREQVLESWQGLVFEDPAARGTLVTKAQYASGNVRTKLAEALEAAETDPAFEANVRFLESVQPETVPAAEIDFTMGAPWLPTPVLQRYVADNLAARAGYAPEVRRGAKGGFYVDSGKNRLWSRAAAENYATKDVPIEEIVEHALNHSYPKVMRRDSKGKRYHDREATQAAKSVIDALRRDFADWAKSDPSATDDIAEAFNTKVNVWARPVYDGSTLQFPGLDRGRVTERAHQADAVARVMQEPGTLLWHGMGSGKTFTIAMAAMKLRQTGLRKKPLIVVYKPTLTQFTREFLEAYPGAKLLAAHEESFSKQNKDLFLAQAAMGDWDAVIVTHEQFQRMPLGPEATARFYDKQILEMVTALAETYGGDAEKAAKDRSQPAAVRQLARDILKMEERRDEALAKLANNPPPVTFEQSGVDALFVDEMQFFKGVPTPSNREMLNHRVSQKAINMMMAADYLHQTPNTTVAMASGTPIQNSIVEFYNLIRYHRPDLLRDNGFRSFDDFAEAFLDSEARAEQALSGRVQMKERIRGIVNMTELMGLFSQVADVMPTEAVPEITLPDLVDGDGNPTDGQAVVVQCKLSEDGKRLAQQIAQTQIELETKPWQPGDPPERHPLSLSNRQRQLGLDPRLVDPTAKVDPNGKIPTMARKAAEVYAATAADKGTQVIFCDIGVNSGTAKPKKARPSSDPEESLVDAILEDLAGDPDAPLELDAAEAGEFPLYDAIIEELVANGVARDDIVVVRSDANQETRRQVSQQLNEGTKRVLLSTRKLVGVGMNMQARMRAAHHLVVGWNAADMKQGDARVVRHGNLFKGVTLFRYVHEGTFDQVEADRTSTKAAMFDVIANYFKLPPDKRPRRAEDVGGDESLSLGELMAESLGDPRIFDLVTKHAELSDLQREVERIERAAAGAERALRIIDTQKKPAVERERSRADTIAVAAKQGRPKVLFTAPDGTAYEKPTEATRALAEQAVATVDSGQAMRGATFAPVPGRPVIYRGFEVKAKIAPDGLLSFTLHVPDVEPRGAEEVGPPAPLRRLFDAGNFAQAVPSLRGNLSDAAFGVAGSDNAYSFPVGSAHTPEKWAKSVFGDFDHLIDQWLTAPEAFAAVEATFTSEEAKYRRQIRSADPEKAALVEAIDESTRLGFETGIDINVITTGKRVGGGFGAEAVRSQPLDEPFETTMTVTSVDHKTGQQVVKEFRVRAIKANSIGQVLVEQTAPLPMSPRFAIATADQLALTERQKESLLDASAAASRAKPAEAPDELASNSSTKAADWEVAKPTKPKFVRVMDALDDLDRAFNSRTVRGRSKKRTAGVYVIGARKRMVRGSTDLGTEAHELAHMVADETGMFDPANGDPARFDSELSDPKFEKTIDPKTSPDVHRQERFAEWLRLWMRDPAKAEAAAPRLAAALFAALPGRKKAALVEFSEATRAIAHMAPQDAVRASIAFDQTDRSFREWLNDKLGHAGRRLAGLTEFGEFATRAIDVARVALTSDVAAFDSASREAMRRRGVDVKEFEDQPRGIRPSENPIVRASRLSYVDQRVAEGFRNGLRDGKGRRVTRPVLSLFTGLDWSGGKKSALAEMSEFVSVMVAQRHGEKARQIRQEATDRHREFFEKTTLAMMDSLEPQLAAIKAAADSEFAGYRRGVNETARRRLAQLEPGSVEAEAVAEWAKAQIDAARTWRDRRVASESSYAESRARSVRDQRVAKHARRIAAVTAHRIQTIMPYGYGGVRDAEATSKAAAQHAGTFSPEKTKRFREFAEGYREIGEWSIRRLEESGLISAEQRKQILDDNQFWIDVHRMGFEDAASVARSRSKGSLASVKAGVPKRFKGSTRVIKDPVTSLIEQVYKVERSAQKNETLRAFFALVASTRNGLHSPGEGMADIAFRLPEGSKRSNEDVVVYVEGKETRYHVPDPVLRASIKFVDGVHLPRWLDSLVDWTIGLPKRVLQKSVTTFFAFAATNFLRDTAHRLIVTDTGSGLRDFKRSTAEELADYDAYGIGLGQLEYASSAEGWARTQKRLMAEADPDKTLLHDLGKPVEWYLDKLNAAERANRLAEYRSALREAERRGLKGNDAREFAAYEARRRMTDFRRAGVLIRALNRVVPFLNAHVQGQAAAYTAAAHHPGRLIPRLMMLAGLGIGLERAWAAATGTEDDLDKVDQTQRDLFFHFKVGPDTVLRVPKGFEFGLTVSFLDRLLRRFEGDEHAMQGFLARAWKISAPAPLTEASALGGAGTVVQVAMNRNEFTGRAIVPPWEERVELDLRKSKEQASPIAGRLQDATGVDARYWDFIATDQFAYYGRFVVDASKATVGQRSWEQVALSTTGVVRPLPPIAAPDVDFVRAQKALVRMTQDTVLDVHLDAYFAAKSPQQREEHSDRAVAVARRMRSAIERARRGKKGRAAAEAAREALKAFRAPSR